MTDEKNMDVDKTEEKEQLEQEVDTNTEEEEVEELDDATMNPDKDDE